MNQEETTESGWLSTRNKRKISPPAVCVKRKRSTAIPYRPVGWGQPSAYYTLTQNSPPPPELFTHTRQTSIVSFFRTGTAKGEVAEDPELLDNTVKNSHSESVELSGNEESFAQQTQSLLHHSPGGDDSSQLTDMQMGHGCEKQQSEKRDTDITWSANSDSIRKSKNENSCDSLLGSQILEVDSPEDTQTCITPELHTEVNFTDAVTLSQENCCPVEAVNLCSQDSEVPHSRSGLETDYMSQVASPSELSSQWERDDPGQGKTDTSVTDSEEPFTFAFLSQDPTLRTRGVTPIGMRQFPTKADGVNSGADEEFTLTSLDSNFTNGSIEHSDFFGTFEDDSECILDSQELESEESDSAEDDFV